jgi:hypothetical protein
MRAMIGDNRTSRLRHMDQHVPVLLRPVIRAYVLAYASSTVPRLLTYLSKRKRTYDEVGHLIDAVLRILRGGLEWRRFPTFCAALIGGSTFLQVGHPL